MKTTPTENPQEEDAERKVKSALRAAEQLPIEMVDLLAKPAWL